MSDLTFVMHDESVRAGCVLTQTLTLGIVNPHPKQKDLMLSKMSPFSFRAVVEGAPPQGLPREQVAAALLGHHRGVPQRRVQVR